MADQPEMEMHHHGQIPEVMPQFPHLGNSQRVVPGPIYQLEDLERMATAHNPTLIQAQRAVEAARGRQWQSGLYPNPTSAMRAKKSGVELMAAASRDFLWSSRSFLAANSGLIARWVAGEVKQRQADAEAQRLPRG